MRNVVLICLDTVRQDYFAEYATRLGSRADVVFSECRAASSWSAPSHASMFTGTLPERHGVHTYNRDFSGLSRADTFLGDLPDHHAVGTSANVWAGSSFGFDGLFDDFSDVSPDQRFPGGIDVARFGQECEREGVGKQLAFLRAALDHDRPLRSLANGAYVQLEQLSERAPLPKLVDDGASILAREALRQVEAGTEPFALFVNFMDAHGPLHHVRGYDRDLHDAPNAWTSGDVTWTEAVARGDEALLERYRNLYAAAIDYLDRVVCEFVDDLQAATARETTVVVTSDHGDNLGTAADRGLWGHTESALTEGLLHVPCVVLNAPDGADRDRNRTRDEERDRNRDLDQDLEATVIDERFSHLALRELLVGYATGDRSERALVGDPVLAERAGHSGKQHGEADRDPGTNRVVRAVYEGDRKAVYGADGEATAYRLDPERPCWQTAVEEAVDVDRLDRLFDEPIDVFAGRVRADGDDADEMDQATRDRLAQLGYL